MIGSTADGQQHLAHVLAVLDDPAAQQSKEVLQVTLPNEFKELLPFGDATRVHAKPFQCSIKVSREFPFGRSPTIQQSAGELHLIP